MPFAALINSFRTRLIVVFTMIAGVSCLLMGTVFAILQYEQTRTLSLETLQSQAEMVATHTAASIDFERPEEGAETLASLRSLPEVGSAAVYLTDQQLFATYQRSENPGPIFKPRAYGQRKEGNWLVFTRAILDPEGVRVGDLVITEDLSSLYTRLRNTLLLSAVVVIGVMAVAVFIALRIQRSLAKPVDELAKVAIEISRTGDYTIRARKYADDELGQLTDQFNQMVGQIQRQEQELQSASERFRTAVEAAPNAMVMVDGAGNILLVNAQTERMFGYSRDELIGQSVEILVPERYRERHPAFRRTFFAAPVARPMGAGRDLFGRRKDGSEFPVEIGLSPIHSSEGLHVLSSIVDITERKRTEQALRRSEEEARRQFVQLEAIYKSAPVGLCFVDPELRYVNVNERLADMNGAPVAAHIGKTISEVLPPDLARRKGELYRHMLESNQLVMNAELRAKTRADGEERDWLVSLYPVFGPENELLGVNTVVQDITDRKHAERERLALLESERAARSEAERASHMKDNFLATLSHELRTPLTAILGWAQMLRQQGSQADVEHGLEVIERNARAQTQIIEDLLDMSRIISGKLRLDVQLVPLAEVVEAAVATVRPAAEAREIRLQSVIDPHVQPVRGDPSRLQQIVWNLLSNAIKFTPRGGRVQVSVQRVNSHVEIAVSDTGQGIAPEFLPFVFDRFRQADASTTRKHGGLGLGLAIARQLAELHGGTIRAASPGEGKGSTFTVVLPFAVIHAHDPSEVREHPRVDRLDGKPGEPLTLDGTKVIVIDDDPDAREFIGRLVAQHGGNVRSVASGLEGLRLLEEFQPDVIVSDIGMPELDGYDFMRRVRTLPKNKGGATPAVALTAFARTEDRIKSLVAGYQMHVAKPVNATELLIAILSLAGRRAVEKD